METEYLETWKDSKTAVKHYTTGHLDEYCLNTASQFVDK
jgi:hypothetical protein